MDINLLDAVSTGFIGSMDNNFFNKRIEQFGEQLIGNSVLTDNFQKTIHIYRLPLAGFDNFAELVGAYLQSFLLLLVICGHFCKAVICHLTNHMILI